MAKRILVPLDRSEAAESVLPLVADIARGSGATVRLLHVAPIPHARIEDEGRVIAYADQETARVEAEAMDHLRAVEVQFGAVPVECAVRFGDPAREILREAEEFGADLVAVSTTGRSGVGRVLLGSVAERLLRKAPVAIMVLRPDHLG